MNKELTNHIKAVYSKSKCIFTKEDIDLSISRMAKEISDKVGESSPIFLCVLLGGMIPLGNLLPRLDFPLEIDYIHVGRYGYAAKGGEINWKAKPRLSFKDRTVVIVDDILDEGITFATIVDYCKSQGAREIFTAAMIDKKKARGPSGLKDVDFKGLEVDDLFVFGFGLDYQGYLRNAPGIYAVPPDTNNK